MIITMVSIILKLWVAIIIASLVLTLGILTIGLVCTLIKQLIHYIIKFFKKNNRR